VIYQQNAVGGLLNRAGNALPVLLPEDEGPQNEEIKSALKKGEALVGFCLGRMSTRDSLPLFQEGRR